MKIRSNVNKKNVASLATHRKCGFTIGEENGINYLCGEQYDHLYGMMYSSEAEDEMKFKNEMRLDDEFQMVITRVCQMESYLDDVLQAMNTCPETVKNNPAIREKIQVLKNYYESGLWLADYEWDERGELPDTLKRGVLSQDTLYDLLNEIENIRICGE